LTHKEEIRLVVQAKHIASVDTRTKVALFRHSLVAQLAERKLEHGELTRELRRLAARKHKIPGSLRTSISVASLRRWLRIWKASASLEALKPSLRADYGHSRKIPEEWLKKAIALRQEVPERTATVMVEILSTQEGCPDINAHTLDKVLRRLGMTRQQMRGKAKQIKRWSARCVNDLWQGDATDGIWLPHPTRAEKMIQTTLFVWIDDFSRFLVHAEFFYDERLPRMERTLKLALLKRGIPRRIYTDNGSVYVAGQFQATMAELGIKRIRSRVGQPRGRGKVERVIKTIQRQFYPEAVKAKIKTLTDLNEALWAWIECIYHKRKHRGIDARPVDVWQQGNEHVRSVDAVKLTRAFLWRYERKVSSNGFLSLFSNQYSVDPSWSGHRIELRLDPFDLSNIHVYLDQRPVAKASIVKLKRGAVIEVTPLAPPPAVGPSGISFLDAIRRRHLRQLAAETGEVSFLKALQPQGKEAQHD
jgi:putative transposase